MVFNDDEGLMDQESLRKKYQKCRELYLQICHHKLWEHHILPPHKNWFQKWNELKHVLMEKCIGLSARVKFLTTFVRSPLLYRVQAWEPTEYELCKVVVIWHRFLRKMEQAGFESKYVGPVCRLKSIANYRNRLYLVKKDLDLDREAVGHWCSAGQENDHGENTVPVTAGPQVEAGAPQGHYCAWRENMNMMMIMMMTHIHTHLLCLLLANILHARFEFLL